MWLKQINVLVHATNSMNRGTDDFVCCLNNDDPCPARDPATPMRLAGYSKIKREKSKFYKNLEF